MQLSDITLVLVEECEQLHNSFQVFGNIFSAIGYEANIDSSDTLGAMNFQMWRIISVSPGSIVHVSIQEIPFLAYL